MSGGHLANFKKIFRFNLLLAFLLNGLVVFAVGLALRLYTSLDDTVIFGIVALTLIVTGIIQTIIWTNILIKPTEYLSNAIFHISPNQHLVAAPNVDELTIGKELVATLTRQIYDYAAKSSADNHRPTGLEGQTLINSLPVPIIGLDENGKIILHNKAAEKTFNLQNPKDAELDKILQMKFTSKSFKEWIIETKSRSINSSNTWQKVDVSSDNGNRRSYFDVAASFRQNDEMGIEQVLVFFERSKQFEDEDNTISLIAISVHELRTPLTILRGYIEALRIELEGKVDEKTKEDIERLSVSSENLAAYVANILSVAKADENELEIQLQEGSWEEFLKKNYPSFEQKTKVRDKVLKLNITPNLPSVAFDPTSINEVMFNLIDNAIKYSPDDKKNITIDVSVTTDGSVLTKVIDEGVGIPESVMDNLFTRFYRNHRNRKQISGTGLGLYISKEIMNAHHGNIWVDSVEGEGTSVSFTLIPYSRLADTEQSSDNEFRKVKHGWIKNHNMQRR